MTQKPTTILIVDDVEASRYTLARMLEKANYEVQAAATGGDALRLATKRPDLIILDIIGGQDQALQGNVGYRESARSGL